MTSVSVGICAHISRLDAAAQLHASLELPRNVTIDTGAAGELANHDRAWALALELAEQQPPGDRWCLVLEDDAVLVDDFADVATRTLAAAPFPALVSFYLGRERPLEWQRRLAATADAADAVGASWIRARNLLWGVAVAMPAGAVPPMLAAARRRRRYQPYDEWLSTWARYARLPVLYAWPSPVDHADGEPVITKRFDGMPRDRPRVAWRHGAPAPDGPIVDLL